MPASDEHQRTARELHDAVSQTLFAARVVAGTLVRQAERAEPADVAGLAAQARVLEQLNRGAQAELAMLQLEMRPERFQGQPLGLLLQHPVEALACRGGITVQALLAESDLLAPTERAQLYRIACRLLGRIAAVGAVGAVHRAWIDWQPAAAGGPCLRVRDDGPAPCLDLDTIADDPAARALDEVRDRAATIGAEVLVRRASEGGTDVRIQLPRPALSRDPDPAPVAP